MAQSALENGAGQIMQALLGGGRVEQNAQLKQQMAYDQADGLRADLDHKITQAYLERDKRKAQQSYRDKFVATGMDPTMADMTANAAIGGLASNLHDVQQYDLTNQAHTALAADPNITAANAALAALHGQPISDVRIDDGNAITHQFGAAPTIAPTQEALAKIATEAARQRELGAHTGVYDAQAAAGGFANGNPRAVGGAGKPEAYTEPAAALLIKALDVPDPKTGQPDGVLTSEEMAGFNNWRAAHPDFRNGGQALDQYLAIQTNANGDPNHYTNFNPVARDTPFVNSDGYGGVAPAGTDPNIVDSIGKVARAAQDDGHPMDRGQLRAVAELMARGKHWGFANGRVYEADENGKPTAGALALHPDLAPAGAHPVAAAPQAAPAGAGNVIDHFLSYLGIGGGDKVSPHSLPDLVAPGAQHAQHAGAVVAAANRPPPAALARLKEGVITRFGNGQSWTLQGGQPVMVP